MEPITVVLEFNTIVTDSATGTEGMLTHLLIEIDGSLSYNFQPKGLNPETGRPVKGAWLKGERIRGGHFIPAPPMPLAALGTEAEDIATGFKGTVVALVLHNSGCFHASLQAKGMLNKTGSIVDLVDIDLRRLKGPAIPVLSKAEIKVDQARKPSPMDTPTFQRDPL